MMKLENQNHSFSLQHTQVSHITYTGHLSTKRGQWDLAQAAASEPDSSAAHTHTHILLFSYQLFSVEFHHEWMELAEGLTMQTTNPTPEVRGSLSSSKSAY